MDTSLLARRRRRPTALLQLACFAQAGFAAFALSGVARGSPSADRPPMASEARDDRQADQGIDRVDRAVEPSDSATPVSPLPNALLVSTELLEQMRGGYERSDGANTLKVTFGVERAVYVNGALVSTSSLALDGLGRLVGSGAAAQGLPAGASGLTADSLRLGAGNALATNATELPTGALVLQNSLNDQRLEARTTINAVVEGAQLMRAARLESIMRDSSVGAVRR